MLLGQSCNVWVMFADIWYGNFIEGLREGEGVVVQSSSHFGHVKWIRQYYLVTLDTLSQQMIMSLEVGVIIDWD